MATSCGTRAMRPRTSVRIGRRDVDAVERHRARRRVVEAQQQVEDRALAGAGGADDRHRLAGRDREATMPSSTAASGAGRDRRRRTPSKATSPRGGLGQRAGRGRGGDRAARPRSSSARRSAAPAAWRDLAPDLREFGRARRRRTPHRARTGRACPASCGRPARPGRRTTARRRREAKTRKMRDDGQHGARAGSTRARASKAPRPRRRSASCAARLAGEGLQRCARRRSPRAAIGGGVGQRVLRERASAGAPSGRSRPAAAR